MEKYEKYYKRKDILYSGEIVNGLMFIHISTGKYTRKIATIDILTKSKFLEIVNENYKDRIKSEKEFNESRFPNKKASKIQFQYDEIEE